MTRVIVLTFALISVLFSAACSGVASLGPSPVGQQAVLRAQEGALPNIIYILADDMGFGDPSFNGQTRLETPNLDRLAAGGMVFTQHYAGAPICAPSRSTFMTGQHTGNTEIRSNGGKRQNAFLQPETQTIGNVLQDAGYTTGTVGKWGLGSYADAGSPQSQGMDYFYGYVDQLLAHNYYPPYLIENGDKHILDNGGISLHPFHINIAGVPADRSYRSFIGKEYSADLIHGKAKEFIHRSADGPFFLYYASTIPHAALQIEDGALAPFSYPEVGEEGGYYPPHPRPRAARAAMITLLDQQVGEIMDLVQELGIADNTLIVFTSDNGPSIEGGSDVAFFNASGGFRGQKRNLTEGGIRVPMVAYWPGKIAPGTTSDQTIAMWDMLATAADLADTNLDKPSDSISFLPAMLGQPDQQDHDYLYWEFHGNNRIPSAQAVRLGDWKALRIIDSEGLGRAFEQPIALYDLSLDRTETNDVSGDNPEVVARMKDIMAARTRSKYAAWNFE